MKTPQTLFCERVLLPQGWARDTTLEIDLERDDCFD